MPKDLNRIIDSIEQDWAEIVAALPPERRAAAADAVAALVETLRERGSGQTPGQS